MQLKRLLQSLGLLFLLLGAVLIYTKGLPWATGKITLIYVADADEVNAAPAQEDRLSTLRGGRGRHRGVLTIAGTSFPDPSERTVANGELAGTRSVDIINRLGIDVAVPGGHAFDRPELSLRTLVHRATGFVISDNVVDASGKPVADLSPGIVIPVWTWAGLVDVGFVGLTQENAPSWATRTDPIEAAKKEVPGTRRWARAVVVVTDLSIADGRALFAAVPDIDLLIGGRDRLMWTISPGVMTDQPVVGESKSSATAVMTIAIDRAKARPVTTVRFEGT